MEIERMISVEEKKFDNGPSLRPKKLSEYIGQDELRKKLNLFIRAAKKRSSALDHVLLSGPPGLGKTTMAHIIAAEMGTRIHTLTGPNLERKGDLAAILVKLEPGDILFIDEIHRLHRAIEEVLYGAMEDYKLDIVMGEGPAADTLQVDLPHFTLVGATTRSGLLSRPLRDRFGIPLHVNFYPVKDLEEIVVRSARVLNVDITRTGAHEVARRSRGTPRIANRLLQRVRDFALVESNSSIVDHDIAKAGLELLDVDEKGLDALDRRYLKAIIEKFDFGPVGIDNLAAALGEERDTIEDVIEPYLIQEGFIQRTQRGRITTNTSHQHFGVSIEVQLPEILSDT